MNSSFMKLLQEDEDETMHYGAEFDAFIANLNMDAGFALSQEINHTPDQLCQQWQSSKREEVKTHIQDQQSSSMEVHRQMPGNVSQYPPNHTSGDINHDLLVPNRPQDDQSITQNLDNTCLLQRMSNQQDMTTGQTVNAMNRPAGREVPFASLFPLIQPRLDNDRAMQLQSGNINKFAFVRHLRALVGEHMIKVALYKFQQGQLRSWKMDLTVFLFAQLSAKQNTKSSSPYVAASSIHQSSDPSTLPMEKTLEKIPLLERQSGSHGARHTDFPQSSFSSYGNIGGNHQTGGISNVSMSSASLQMGQGPIHPIKTDVGGSTHFTNNSPNSSLWQPSRHKDQSLMSSMTYRKPDHMDHTFEISSRHGFSTPTNKPKPRSITAQLECQNASAGIVSLAAGNKTPPPKPTVATEKPLEVSPVYSLSKKQRVSGSFSDHSIHQLNDVVAVGGVNLQEEEEQLFSRSKEENRVSEVSRKVVQEEEKRLFLQKVPLQKKLAEIMSKCGVMNKANDVEQCLSLCTEERMHGLITNLIRLSKQRVNIEKARHRTVITSDVWQQILSLNQKAREEWEEKQADADKLQRADEVNKEQDDKMRADANVAARAAAGGDDMLSKWKLKAERLRKKFEGGPDAESASQPSAVLTSERKSSKDNPDTEMTSHGRIRKSVRNQDLGQSGDSIPFSRSVSVKDVISVLEREIKMSRSTLTYNLYEHVHSDSVSE
ncbi:hypothetical protein QVD17_10343 [Tagetes erecta]|uniref:Uncharacterized protein n=1 Tax=Tagetes erecta TaxID=13708 RepID=A0AAD8L5K0_TARER|nr:hypothetical protein QVD17_10343 [Tagetes erecta]